MEKTVNRFDWKKPRERVVTYLDWQMDFDPQTGKYYVFYDDGVFECELVKLVENADDYTEQELLDGIGLTNSDFDFSGELDKPIEVGLGIVDGVHKYDYIYQYGFWRMTDGTAL